MSSFSPEWLALREPADHAARSAALTRAAAEAIGDASVPRILDLAAGTGSNLRYLTAIFPGAEWLLVDSDETLLARVPKVPGVETRRANLAPLDDPSIFAGRGLVTASALLDLVSEAWLDQLARLCARNRSTVLFALTYDGRIHCTPEDPMDAAIVALVNAHQRTEKGFGVAQGPAASDCAARCLSRNGYQVQRAPSDWTLPPAMHALQRPLIEGWAHAAAEIAPAQADTIDAWRTRRLACLDAGRSQIVVGHEDILGICRSTDLRI